MSNPLFDTLFRPTTRPSAELPPTATAAEVASAAPVRVRGTRTRAGNAMSRTREALMSGAARAVASDGTKITMARVAVSAGVAKATLYNHFRTREAVLAALVEHQAGAVVDAQVGKRLDAALADAALAISRHPVRRGLASVEPAALAALARVDGSAAGWIRARAGVAAALADAGRSGTDTIVRWLASFLLTPGDPVSIAADVAVLLAGLPREAESAA